MNNLKKMLAIKTLQKQKKYMQMYGQKIIKLESQKK